MKGELTRLLSDALLSVGVKDAKISLEYPENPEHGDFSSNAALAYAKELKMSPKALAQKIAAEFMKFAPVYIESVDIAGPGFINFKLKDDALAKHVVEIAGKDSFKLKSPSAHKKVLVEYTDPNTFKVFHIGHLMSNAIGESLARLIEFSGSKVVRICYPSDIGLHIAKSVWATKKNISAMPSDKASIQEKTAFLGKMYVEGTTAYENDPLAKKVIDELNKIIYERSDKEVNALVEKGKAWSLEHFDLLYKILGTKFDDTIFESEMAPLGAKIVQAEKDVFELSEGAMVFKGEEFGLHTRVFLNSQGLPTYEAKELGLNITKFKNHPDADLSVIITANEQNDYFRVLSKVIALVDKDNGSKLKHIGHGMMRFEDGKMSSRKGNVITADDLIADMKALVAEKMKERDYSAEDSSMIAEQVAVAAIKYTVLRSSVGSDIIFDSSASISFEGDSGPYLQYSAVRANSVLEKAGKLTKVSVLPEKVGHLERLLVRFPDVAARAAEEFSPQQVAGYLINLAGAFNNFYGNNQILDDKEPLSAYRLALTSAFKATMTEGLGLLGIKVPSKM